MGRYQFDDGDRENGSLLTQSTKIMTITIRGAGFVLLIFGLWIAFGVISNAWSLYHEPRNIERFAHAIEQGSNLDSALLAVNRSTTSDATLGGTDRPGIRVSYFIAWIIALLLLMLIGQLALSAVKIGGQLALYDVEIKKLARELIRQSGREPSE